MSGCDGDGCDTWNGCSNHDSARTSQHKKNQSYRSEMIVMMMIMMIMMTMLHHDEDYDDDDA